jgi:hypothetical protein
MGARVMVQASTGGGEVGRRLGPGVLGWLTEIGWRSRILERRSVHYAWQEIAIARYDFVA